MNFFEQQDRAHRATRRLVLLFVLATVLIVAAVTAVVAGVVMTAERKAAAERGVRISGSVVERHGGLLAAVALGTLGLIGMGSLTKTLGLRAGGGAVAQALGGVPLAATDLDPRRKRLQNVVEEMAIASGSPVPEVYLLENEESINAFAAGLTPGDAAVAVTRGTLERLNRDELQGVVAHEFSHILNGDMRLNMKLMGVLHGILLIGLTGQTLMRAAAYGSMVRGRNDRNNGGVALILIGLAVMVVGFIGVFFGQLIKAGVSRQREYLADASAVQFTRHPGGIAGALKKIGGFSSKLKNPKADEVSHMLFGAGTGLSSLFATHPPIVKRIRAIEPGFDPRELERYADARADAVEAEGAMGFSGGGAIPVTPRGVVESAGRIDTDRVRYAGRALGAIPGDLRNTAASVSGAQPVLFALLLSGDAAVRERQERMLDEAYDPRFRTAVSGLADEVRRTDPALRLPLVELAMSSLRHRSGAERDLLLRTVDGFIEADGRIEVFEFALSRVLRAHVDELHRGDRPRTVRLGDRADDAEMITALLAVVGHADAAAAEAAMKAGMAELELPRSDRTLPPDDWVPAADRALERLDDLRPRDKERVVAGFTAAISHDGVVTREEGEVLRAVCAAIHVPVPPLDAGPGPQAS